MRAILIAVMLCVGMAWAGEVSVDDAVADRIEKQIESARNALVVMAVSLRQLEVEGKGGGATGYHKRMAHLSRVIAEKQAALAKVRPTLTPDQEIARAEAGVKAAEDALAKAKGELERAKAKGPKKN